MNFFILNSPYKGTASCDFCPDDMIDFQFTTGARACECVASTSVYHHLCSAKQTIETCNPDDWDAMKKITNPYEYIHTSIPGHKYSVSRFKPLSRSFYKMIEIIKQCKLFPATYRPHPGTQSTSGADGELSSIRRRDYRPPYHYAHHYNHNNHGSHSQYPPHSQSHHSGYYNQNQNQKKQAYGENGFYKQQQPQEPQLDTIDASTASMELHVTTTTTTTPTETALLPTSPDAIRSFHLAEGPGGFIEALCYIRSNPNDVYYGMTLVDETANSACPGWKKSRLFLDRNPSVKLEHGKDGTGNLLSLDNYLHCCEKYRHSMDFITADGGFDFSSDFNHQEVLAQTLVVSEVLYAVSLQKPGGTFVLKIFDLFTRVTVDIVHLLAALYTDVIIFKPNTSRVANSEKYIVCKGFKVQPQSAGAQMVEAFSAFFRELDRRSKGKDQQQARDECAEPVDDVVPAAPISIGAILRSTSLHKLHLIHRIEEVNAILGQHQIENIINTVALIHGKSADRVESYKKNHIQKCIEWCERYNIPYNKHAVSPNPFISTP